MAYVNIKPVHKTINKCLSYVAKKCSVNELSAINCSTEHSTASLQFDITQRLYEKDNYKNTEKKKVIAHHMIQSFSKDDNVTVEQAKKIAVETVRRHFDLDEKNFQIFIGTHTNTDKIHNHIIISSISMDGEKYHSNKTNLHKLQQVSNEVCIENKLKTIGEPQRNKTTSVPYNEWELNQKGYSWKDKFKRKIDMAILRSDNIEQLLATLEKYGVDCEIKKDKHEKFYLGVRSKGFEKFYINTKTLGEDYDLETLDIRCKSIYKQPIVKRKPRKIKIVRFSKRYGFSRYRSKSIFNTRKYFRKRNSKTLRKHKITIKKIIDLILGNKIYNQKYDNSKPYDVRNDVIVNALSNDIKEMDKNDLYNIEEMKNKITSLEKQITSSKETINKVVKSKNNLKFIIATIYNYEQIENTGQKIDYLNENSNRNEIIKKYKIDNIEELQNELLALNNQLEKEQMNLKELVAEEKNTKELLKRCSRIENETYIDDLLNFTKQQKEKNYIKDGR